MFRIGRIYANIAGDSRYGQNITVHLLTTAAPYKARVQVTETSPVGGMDGCGGFHEDDIKDTRELVCNDVKKLSAEIVRTIKDVLEKKGDTVKRYGKPTKNFGWLYTRTKGLSSKSCLNELETVLMGSRDDE